VRATIPFVAESTGEENANLYKRGVNEGSRGGLLDAFELLELLDVFGEDVRNGETVAVLLWGMVMIPLIVFISELFLVPRI
jgi:hypothetical protein